MVEGSGHVSGHFDVLFLVFTNGNEVRFVDENVGGLKDRIGEQSGGGVFFPFGHGVFPRVGAFKHAKGCDGVENPCQFSVFGNVALAEKGGGLWV